MLADAVLGTMTVIRELILKEGSTTHIPPQLVANLDKVVDDVNHMVNFDRYGDIYSTYLLIGDHYVKHSSNTESFRDVVAQFLATGIITTVQSYTLNEIHSELTSAECSSDDTPYTGIYGEHVFQKIQKLLEPVVSNTAVHSDSGEIRTLGVKAKIAKKKKIVEAKKKA